MSDFIVDEANIDVLRARILVMEVKTSFCWKLQLLRRWLCWFFMFFFFLRRVFYVECNDIKSRYYDWLTYYFLYLVFSHAEHLC